MTKSELLEQMKTLAEKGNNVQFNYSRDPQEKAAEMNLLKQLEADGEIYKVTAALGYAVYRLL